MRHRVINFSSAVIISLGVMLMGASCSRDGARTAEPICVETQRGPVTALVRADTAEMSVAERLELSVEAIAEPGYVVQLPDLADKLGEFRIVESRSEQPELLDGGKTRTRLSLVLEPFLPGCYVIPSVAIKYGRVEDGSKLTHSLETGTTEVAVRSVLGEADSEVTFHEVADPLALPMRIWPWLTVLVIVAAVLILLANRKRKTTIEAAKVIPPHDIALERLWQLESEDLPGRGLIKEFYQCVSDILRRYIEDRFGLRAPEQTTEEFLAALDQARMLEERYRPLLTDFLHHCDLVKFAAFQPEPEEITDTFNSCKSFVYGTAEAATDNEQLTTDQ